MISLYTGTPGSGKSLDLARIIYLKNAIGIPILGNVMINDKLLKKNRKGKAKYIYLSDVELTPEYLYAYAREHNKKGKENQTLLVIDECQRLFGSREWNAKDRKAWNEFFQVHRHYGYDIILVTQFDRLIDRQIRSLVEYEVKHRKVNNYKAFGFFLGLLSGGALFVRIEYWYGIKDKVGSEFFRGKRRLYRLYDSYQTFGDLMEEEQKQKADQATSAEAQRVEPEVDEDDLIFISLDAPKRDAAVRRRVPL